MLLFDPLAVPDEIGALATERETAIVPTSPWHQRDALGPLLDLPIELVLPTHGPPADRAALERALS
jgi:hypothetical protein